jgi:hypothetical protein
VERAREGWGFGPSEKIRFGPNGVSILAVNGWGSSFPREEVNRLRMPENDNGLSIIKREVSNATSL